MRADNPGLVYYHLRKVLDVGPDYLDKLTKFFKRAAEEMDKGIEMLHKADELVNKETGKRQIEEWVDRVTSHVCGFYSMVNYLEFVKVLKNKTPWQREQVMELMRKELRIREGIRSPPKGG